MNYYCQKYGIDGQEREDLLKTIKNLERDNICNSGEKLKSASFFLKALRSSRDISIEEFCEKVSTDYFDISPSSLASVLITKKSLKKKRINKIDDYLENIKFPLNDDIKNTVVNCYKSMQGKTRGSPIARMAGVTKYVLNDVLGFNISSQELLVPSLNASNINTSYKKLVKNLE